MRPIKFRSWNIDLKEFIGPRECLGGHEVLTFLDYHKDYGQHYSYDCFHPDKRIVERSWRDFSDKHFVLQEYTGLNDIFNTEIYEGDYLFKVNIDSNGKYVYQLDPRNVFTVIYQKGAFVVEDEDKSVIPLGFSPFIWEICGNIFEGPELSVK